MSGKNKKRRKKNGKSKQTIIRQLGLATNETIVPEDMRSVDISFHEIGVVKKVQKGIICYSGEMSLSQLASLTYVDVYDGNNPDAEGAGQRTLNELRGRHFGEFISDKDNICFAELLINERAGKVEFTSIREMGIDIPHHQKLAATHGFLRIPSDAKLFVYDGATRRFGYLSLLHFEIEMLGEDAYAGCKNLNVPFCLCQVSPAEETKLFLEHNKQTSVASDHKALVSWHANKSFVDVKNHTPSETARSIIAGMTFLMDKDRTCPWSKMIAMPDLSKEENKKRLGSQNSFNTGMKRFVAWLNKSYWSPETSMQEKSSDLAEMTTIFWRAIKKACPKIWRTPDDYVQLRPLGISSLSLLMHMMYIDFFNTDKEWTIENIHPELKKSKLLTTPRLWEVGGDIQKRGGNYKALESINMDIYKQMKQN